jgi:eukaryotic-like serine/threonine-protein kinase
MRAESFNTPTIQPWVSAVHPRGTLHGIMPERDEKRDGVIDVAPPEPEGQTPPYRQIERPAEVASAPASEAAAHRSDASPTPRPDAPRSRPISSAVLRLTRLGKYELTGQIGHGSFGDVYTARDTELDREVALKILNPSHHGDEEAMHRFLLEGRAAARIAHPGIVTVHDCGRLVPDGGEALAYIAMERLIGESLAQRLARAGRLAPAEAAEIARQVAAALEAAHRADVLHRDLKPDNVFLVADPAVPAGERAKVLDFGLAKIGTSRHTRLGSVFGTPLYMSPEQCRSSSSIDARSDIYALGCILFELLTGRAPFEGAIYEVVERHLHDPAPRASSLVPGLPPALDALVAAMLEKDPAARPQTMADVAAALAAAITAPAAVIAAPAAAPAGAPSGVLEAPLQLAPADVAALDALVGRRPASPRAPRRERRGLLALIGAIAIAGAIAGALALMAASSGTGGGGGGARPAASSTSR